MQLQSAEPTTMSYDARMIGGNLRWRLGPAIQQFEAWLHAKSYHIIYCFNRLQVVT